MSSRPTLKEHGFRIVSHVTPSMGSRRSTANIHRSIQNLIKNQNIERPVYNWTKKNSTKKVVRVENELLRARQKAQKQQEKEEKAQRKTEKESAKAEKAAAMENLNNIFSRMQM